MKLANGILGLAAAGAITFFGYAQETPKSDKAEMTKAPVVTRQMPIQTIFLTNATSASDGNELVTGIRVLLTPDVKIYLNPGQNSISVSGTPEEIAAAQKLIAELDRPKHSYRLNFTLTERGRQEDRCAAQGDGGDRRPADDVEEWQQGPGRDWFLLDDRSHDADAVCRPGRRHQH